MNRVLLLTTMDLKKIDIQNNLDYNEFRNSYFPKRRTIMSKAMFVEDVKVLDKGQITIPKKVRQVLGAEKGNRLMFVVEGNNVRIVNSLRYAFEYLQKQMKEYDGKYSDEEIMNWVKEMRGQYEA